MKQLKYALIILCSAACFMSGCKKDWLDVNYNPLQLTENNATPDLMLPAILLKSQSTNAASRLLQNWMGYWAHPAYPSGSTATSYALLDYSSIDVSPNPEILLMEQNAVKKDQPFYIGIAKILKAVSWARAVDSFNNLPYLDAMDVNNRKPHYDNGQLIYEDLVRQIDTAITLIKGASIDKTIRISSADIMFKGDKTLWVKFGNTVKLRLLMHQASRTDRAVYIKREIDRILAEGTGFLGTMQDADINPGYTFDKPASYFSNNSAFDISVRSYVIIGSNFLPSWQLSSANVTVLDFLKETNDPRIGFLFNPVTLIKPVTGAEPFTQPPPLEYRGNRFGLTVDNKVFPYQEANYISQVGGVTQQRLAVSTTSSGIIKGFNMDSWILTSVESFFLQAEATYRGWLPGEAEIAYKNAVKESFRWLNVGKNTAIPGLSDQIFDNWYNQETINGNPRVSWIAAPDKYKLLMFQKYLAFTGIEPFESWVDYRRNGSYPNIPLSYDPARIGNTMPIRLPYPTAEAIVNGEELAKQGTIDVFNSKIWWMPN